MWFSRARAAEDGFGRGEREDDSTEYADPAATEPSIPVQHPHIDTTPATTRSTQQQKQAPASLRAATAPTRCACNCHPESPARPVVLPQQTSAREWRHRGKPGRQRHRRGYHLRPRRRCASCNEREQEQERDASARVTTAAVSTQKGPLGCGPNSPAHCFQTVCGTDDSSSQGDTLKYRKRHLPLLKFVPGVFGTCFLRENEARAELRLRFYDRLWPGKKQ
jgi:hypothetical protein